MARIVNSIVIVLLMPLTAFTQWSLVPQGQIEAISANVGIARRSSIGGAVLNPASLSNLTGDSISASGSILSYTQFQFSQRSDANGADLSPAPTTQQIPGLFATAKDLGESGHFVSFLHTENQAKFEKFIQTSTSTDSYDFSTNYEYLTDLNSMGIGTGLGYRISKHWDLGILVKLNILKSRSFGLIKYRFNETYTSTFSDENSEKLLLNGRLGAIWSPTSNFSMGTYIQPTGHTLSNRRTFFHYSVSSAGTVEDETNLKPSEGTTPIQSGVGISLKLNAKTTLLFDLSREDSKGYVDPSGFEVKNNFSEFKGSAVEFLTAPDKKWVVGFSQNDLFDSSTNKITIVSLGSQFNISFLKTTLGAYHISYESKNKSNSETNDKFSSLGIIYSTEFQY
jgi:hypothetical protein